MEPFRDDQLIAELRALRPAPRSAFAAELDERSAAGFPRQASLGGPPLSRLAARLRALPPRRLLLPAGAAAVSAVVLATAVVAITEPGTNRINLSSPARPGATSGDVASSTPAAKAHAGGAGSSGVQFEEATPTSGEALSSGAALSQTSRSSGPFASKTAHRDVERSAEVVLGADPAEIGNDAAKVFDAVHAHDGIVLSSSIRDGGPGEAGAEFQLLIPSAKLSDALAAFSGIAEVRSRHDATADITAVTIGVGERLRDSRARIDSLLAQLAGANTDAERAAAEAELRAERRHAASLRSQLAALHRRANLAHVSLRIETGADTTSSSAGGWGVGDALGDAGHILAIAAGVAIVGLAVVGPLALIALLAWLVSRVWVRRSRERALGESP